MADPITWTTLQAIGAQLAAISIAAGYNTDIGQRIVLNAVQRSDSERPSIAIGSRQGDLDLSGERGAGGGALSRKARRMSIVIEAAIDASLDDSERVAHQMLEDIERAWPIQTCLAPTGVGKVQLTGWTILDRPDGIEAVVLQIVGTADYARPN